MKKAQILFSKPARRILTKQQGGRILKTPKDSRIWEIESVLFKPRKKIRLERLSTQRGAEIADSSPKAESKKANAQTKTKDI